MAYTVVRIAERLGPEDLFPAEIVLPLLLIAGLIALVVSLAILVAAFHLFGLTDGTKPFGVPEGTLQVVVALSLILIFAITSLYLRGSLNPEKFFIEGLTADQVAAIPGDALLDSNQTEPDNGATTDVDESRFDVTRLVPIDEDAKDYSTQLLTILGTLVGAVAGFYFGAKSSETAFETGASAGGGSAPPANTSPPVIRGNPRVSDTLRAEPGDWAGSPTPTYATQWQRQTRDDPAWVDVPGSTDATYLVAPEDREGAIRAEVTATNTVSQKTAYSLPTDKIGQAPAPTTPPAIEGEHKEEVTLSVTPGTWVAWPEPSYTYRWERSAPDAETWEPIPNALGTTYKLMDEDVGKRVRVVETAANVAGGVAGSGSQTSAPTKSISRPPVIKGPPTIVGVDPPTSGQTLTVEAAEVSGWPTPTPSFRWERLPAGAADWIPTDVTTETYQVAPDDVGAQLRVVQVASTTDPAASVETPSAPTQPVGAPRQP